jgi:hypothetical protein
LLFSHALTANVGAHDGDIRQARKEMALAKTRSGRDFVVRAVLAVLAIVVLGSLAPPASAAAKSASCQKMTGQVLLTYHNPDTIVLGTGKGMNIATVFTMTPTTTYLRNGVPVTLDGIKYLDMGYISFQAVYPSGTLLACAVVMTGP